MGSKTSTTLEDASHCPRCTNVGQEVKVMNSPNRTGARVHIFQCMNEVCPWYQTRWPVQVNADGTVPIRQPGEREFPHVDPRFGQREVERTIEELNRLGPNKGEV